MKSLCLSPQKELGFLLFSDLPFHGLETDMNHFVLLFRFCDHELINSLYMNSQTIVECNVAASDIHSSVRL
jgi:hypothetical protein